MWRGNLISLMTACVVLFVGATFAGDAAGQDRRPYHTRMIDQPAGLGDVAALFTRPSVPVRLLGVDGPESLDVGEEGRFAASANIGAASLPLRVRWDFGDGATASGLHALHRYAAPGTYTVVVTISNDLSEVTDSLTVSVVDNKSER